MKFNTIASIIFTVVLVSCGSKSSDKPVLDKNILPPTQEPEELPAPIVSLPEGAELLSGSWKHDNLQTLSGGIDPRLLGINTSALPDLKLEIDQQLNLNFGFDLLVRAQLMNGSVQVSHLSPVHSFDIQALEGNPSIDEVNSSQNISQNGLIQTISSSKPLRYSTKINLQQEQPKILYQEIDTQISYAKIAGANGHHSEVLVIDLKLPTQMYNSSLGQQLSLINKQESAQSSNQLSQVVIQPNLFANNLIGVSNPYELLQNDINNMMGLNLQNQSSYQLVTLVFYKN